MYIFLFVLFMYFCINLVFHISNEGDDPVHLAVDGHAVAEGWGAWLEGQAGHEGGYRDDDRDDGGHEGGQWSFSLLNTEEEDTSIWKSQVDTRNPYRYAPNGLSVVKVGNIFIFT